MGSTNKQYMATDSLVVMMARNGNGAQTEVSKDVYR